MTKMNFEGHLSELRKRIIYIILFFLFNFIIGFLVSDEIVHYLKGDIEGLDTLNVFDPSSALMIYMKVSFVFSLIISLPFIAYQLWRFFTPALTEKEKKVFLIYIPFIPLLFIMGAFFAYYIVFPLMIQFMLVFTNKLDVNPVFGLSEYFTLMLNIVIPVSLLFELPVLFLY